MGIKSRPAVLAASSWAACAALWLGVVAAALAAPGIARADGGAPVVAYVVGGGQDSQDLVTIDIAGQRILAHTHVGDDPRAVATSSDGTYVYVAQRASNHVAVLNASTLRVVAEAPAGGGPAGLVFDPWVTDDLFVANSSGNTITVLDGLEFTPPRVIASIQVGEHPGAISLAGPASGITNPNDPELYVANADSHSISVISVTRLRVVATIPLPDAPLSITVPAQGGVGYVGMRSGEILALDLAGHRLMGSVLKLHGSATGAMDYDAVTGDVYVPDAAGDVVEVLAPTSPSADGTSSPPPLEPGHMLPVSGGPSAVAITSDGAFGFVAESNTGKLAMFDLGLRAQVHSFDVGGTPRAVVTGPLLPSLAPAAAASPTVPATSTPAAAWGVRLALYAALGLAALVALGALVWRGRAARKRGQ